MAERSRTFFFFAHQDDEFGVFTEIQCALERGDIVVCAFLTDGEVGGIPSEVRNRESIAVLTKLGVKSNNISFGGFTQGIPDGQLAYHFKSALAWIEKVIGEPDQFTSLYFPAWEGGHHDHDALHATLVTYAEQNQLLEHCWQFPLYNSFRCCTPFFRVLSPLIENGPSRRRTIKWKDRYLHLSLCLAYPSQFRTWLGLFPFVLFTYFVLGRQVLQRVSVERILERPHTGKLFYERRKQFCWNELHRLIKQFRSSGS